MTYPVANSLCLLVLVGVSVVLTIVSHVCITLSSGICNFFLKSFVYRLACVSV